MAAFYLVVPGTFMTAFKPPAHHHANPARCARLPVDRQQTFASIAPYTLEETYEVIDAIQREDFDDLRGELGDLLFQVVFYARMAEEQQRFNFDDICNAISDKLERRHPHIFGEARSIPRPKC